MKCFSSNGLLLADYIEELKDLEIDTITVTVNTLNPQTAEKIYNFVNYKGVIYQGKKAGEILIAKQIEGVEKAIKAGFIVKINSVFIPDLNENDIVEVAKFYSKRGIEIMNIIPLIPVYEMSNYRAPTPEELKQLRNKCKPYVRQFRRCQQCRADAVGVPGVHGPRNALIGKEYPSSEYFHG